MDAFTNDGIQLAGLKLKAPNPAQWEMVGDFFSYEPYGMAMRKNDSDFRAVNDGLMDGIESGKYFEIYDRWFGPKGELPYPMSAGVRTFMLLPGRPQVTPEVAREASACSTRSSGRCCGRASPGSGS